MSSSSTSTTGRAGRIAEGEPLEALLSSDGLRRLGAMVAVDDEGILQGVVTLAQLRRALSLAT